MRTKPHTFEFMLTFILLASFFLACSTTEQQEDPQQDPNDPGFFVGDSNLGSPEEGEGSNEGYDDEGYEGQEDYGEQGEYDQGNSDQYSNQYSEDSEQSDYDEEGNNFFEDSSGDQFNYNQGYGNQNSDQNANAQIPPLEEEYNPLPENSDYAPEEQMEESVAEEVLYNVLWWLGLDFRESESMVKVEMVTIGKPIYKFSQLQNPAGQPELPIKFLEAKMRKKLKRPIDASEFLSPVAYIRTKYHSEDDSTDVIITLRDAVKPELFSHDGNILLNFKIPDRYFGNNEVGQTPGGEVEVLGDADITPVLLAGSIGPDGYDPVGVSDGLDSYVDDTGENQDNFGNEEYNDNNSNFDNNNNQTGESDFDQYNDFSQDGYSVENDSNDNDYDDNNNNENDENYDNENYDDENYNAMNKTLWREYDIKSLSLFAVAQDDFENNYAEGDYYDNEPYEGQNGQDGGDDVFNNSDGNQFDNGLDQNNQAENEDINTSNLDNENSNNLFDNQGADGEDYENYDNVDLSGEETEGQDQAVEARSQALQPISMNFKGANLKEVIRTFSSENGVNFIFPQDVGGEKVDLSFTNVPWDQALQAVLETHSLGLSKLDGDVIRIDRLSTLDKEKKELEKVRESASRLIPTKVLIVRLSYANAADVVKVVTSMLESYKHDKRTRVEADARTNSVIVEAIPTALSKIKALINRVDLQTPQVKVDTRIVEVLKNDNLQLGINWAMPMRTDQSRGLGLGNLVFPNQMYSAFSVDTGIEPASLSNRSAIDLHFGSIGNLFELDIRLRMAEQQNQVRSLQNNSIVVLDNEKAETKVGQIIYQPIPVGNGEDRLTDVEYALKLTVTPHITADGAVQMDIEVENSSAIASNKAIPDKNTRVIKTKLLRENGQTAVIGGVYTTEYTHEYSGVPFLSSIPILGVFFRRKTNQESKRELIIMVTPTVINSDRSLSETSSFENNVGNNAGGSEYNNFGDNYGQSDNFGSANNAGGDNYYGNQGAEGENGAEGNYEQGEQGYNDAESYEQGEDEGEAADEYEQGQGEEYY